MGGFGWVCVSDGSKYKAHTHTHRHTHHTDTHTEHTHTHPHTHPHTHQHTEAPGSSRRVAIGPSLKRNSCLIFAENCLTSIV